MNIEKARVALYGAGVVAGAAMINSLLLLLRQGFAPAVAFMAALVPSLLFGFIGLASRYPCRAMPLRTTSFTRILVAHAGAAAAARAGRPGKEP